MNRHIMIKIALYLVLLTGLIPSVGQRSARAQTDVNFQVFYDQLSPYGSWVSYPDYGYVWVPGAGSGFRPYGTRGHWVYTEDGWAWVSDYEWGWATFHYGNWFYDDSYGWMWMPGYQWAPAWVTWGEYGGNYCWAPIGPRVDIGVSFGSYRPPASYWNFCPRDRIMSAHVSNYYVTNVRTTTVINRVTIINNINRGGGGRGGYLRGPQANNVERFTHRSVRPMAVQASARPGAARVEGGRLNIYRPNVQQGGGAPRPGNVRELHSLPPRNGAAPRPSQPAQTPRPGQQAPRPGPGQQSNRPNPGSQQQQHPVTQPGRPAQQQPGRPAPQPGRETPRPAPQQNHPAPTPVPAQHQQPSRPTPQPARPTQQPRQQPQQPRPTQQPRQQPQQPRPTQQPRQQPQQPRPTQQPRQQPQPQPQRPVQQPQRPAPQPQHQNPPAPRPEHQQ